MRIKTGLVVDVLLVATALAVAITVVTARDRSSLRISSRDWEKAIAGAPSIGRNEASRILIEFMDYQCPACGVHEVVIQQLEQEYPDGFRRVVRQFPLPRNVRSDTAAFAAVCAADQGRFAEMHSALFSRQDLIRGSAWDSLASLAGIRETEEFRSCLSSEHARSSVASDVALGGSLGVSATPTFVLEREWFAGVEPPRLRQKLLDVVQ